MKPQNSATNKANKAVAASAMKNFVTDILMTPARRNICVLNPKMCFPRKSPIALFSWPTDLTPENKIVKICKEFFSKLNAKSD
jgi:hypothetical protein